MPEKLHDIRWYHLRVGLVAIVGAQRSSVAQGRPRSTADTVESHKARVENVRSDDNIFQLKLLSVPERTWAGTRGACGDGGENRLRGKKVGIGSETTFIMERKGVG